MYDQITAETTDDQILARVVSAKEALARQATAAVASDYMRGVDLADSAQALVNAEALARAQMQYREVVINAPHNRMAMLFEIISRPDDAWSGRGNDSKRSANDAVLDWAKHEHQRAARKERQAARETTV